MELTLLAAALTGAAAVWITNRLRRAQIDVERPTDVLIGAAAVGLIVGRLASMVSTGVSPLAHPGDILVVRGGVSTGFATLGALGALAWTHRSRLPTALDQLAPAALAGLAGWHGGCLWRGTCLGTVSELPWAVTSHATAVTRHPVEIYAALAFVLAAVGIARLGSRPWAATGVGLAAAGAIRLAAEPMRVSITGGPVEWYTAAIVIGLAVAISGQRLTRTRPPGPSSMVIDPP